MKEWIKYKGEKPEQRPGYTLVRWATKDGGTFHAPWSDEPPPDAIYYMYLPDVPEDSTFPDTIYAYRFSFAVEQPSSGVWAIDLQAYANEYEGSEQYIKRSLFCEWTFDPFTTSWTTECGGTSATVYGNCPQCQKRVITAAS